jgi:hypothetical protein
MDVNDYACYLKQLSFNFIVGLPPRNKLAPTGM